MFCCTCIKDIEEYDIHKGDELHYHLDFEWRGPEKAAYAVYLPMTKDPIDWFSKEEFYKYFKEE